MHRYNSATAEQKKMKRRRELQENQEWLRITERNQRKKLQRKRVRNVVLGIAVVLGAIAAAVIMHGRNVGEAASKVGEAASKPAWKVFEYKEKIPTEQTADLLMLVNKDHALPEDYLPRLRWLQNKSCAVAEEMYEALKMMLSDGTDEGLQFVVASGYRSTEYQRQLLEEDIVAAMEKQGLTRQQAYEQETRETMPPGYSEHETGLAVDIVSLDYQVLDAEQETTEENKWLQENCSRYGFILRYPRGREDITGIDYESWHFRYVGAEAAKEIMDRGITLEEYLSEG